MSDKFLLAVLVEFDHDLFVGAGNDAAQSEFRVFNLSPRSISGLSGHESKSSLLQNARKSRQSRQPSELVRSGTNLGLPGLRGQSADYAAAKYNKTGRNLSRGSPKGSISGSAAWSHSAYEGTSAFAHRSKFREFSTCRRRERCQVGPALADSTS